MGAPDRSLELLRQFRTDFEFYAPRALRIRTKTGEVKSLVLNRAQRFAHAKLEEQRQSTGKVRAIILKGRQQGMSTYIQGRYYWRVSGEFGKRAQILTHRDDATSNLFEMAERFHQLCPPELRPRTGASNAKELKFSTLDSGYMVATAGGKDVGRGATAQYFHGSEVAFWKDAKDHMAGVGQIVPDMPGTEIVLESTANGLGNVFHSMWEDATRGHSEYIPIFVPWFWQEEYQKAPPPDWVPDPEDADYAAAYGLTPAQSYWRVAKIRDDFRGDSALFDQEYPATPALAFRRVSGQVLIKPEWVVRARHTRGLELIGPRIMGIDVAEYGDDDTAFAYRIGRTVEKIERFHGRGGPEIVALASMRIDAWKPDAVNVDSGGIGGPVADFLKERGYRMVNRVNFGESAYDKDRYHLRRDEMWGEMADWFEAGPVSVPDDDILQIDLTGPTYDYDSSRRRRLESKEHMKEIRKLKSPDSGDALALTFAVRIATGARRLNPARPHNWRT